jgi:hypothetical protein
MRDLIHASAALSDLRQQAGKLVTPGRLELPAYGLGNRRSIRLSYGVTPRNIRELARTVKSGNRRVLGRAATLPLGAPLEPG